MRLPFPIRTLLDKARNIPPITRLRRTRHPGYSIYEFDIPSPEKALLLHDEYLRSGILSTFTDRGKFVVFVWHTLPKVQQFHNINARYNVIPTRTDKR